MKAIPLALACALLGATALVPAAFAQTSGGSKEPTEASPATSSSDTTSRRDWRTGRDDAGGSTSSRDSANRSYPEEEDDVDPKTDASRRRTNQMGRMSGNMMDPDMMRMHAHMMRAHHDARAGSAHLQLKRGDSSIDIRCPARENIGACVDAVSKLMDRLQNMPAATTTTTPR